MASLEGGNPDERKPSLCFCKYTDQHSFKSAKERDTHHANCPERAVQERKDKQTSVIYNRNKDWIKKAREEKLKANKITGFDNTPNSTVLPELKYKYVMN